MEIIVHNNCDYNGNIISSTIDYRDGTGLYRTFDSDGNIISESPINGLEVFSFPPLDATGALTTLLVVLDVITLEDAANVIHEEPEHLIAEAEAWSVAIL